MTSLVNYLSNVPVPYRNDPTHDIPPYGSVALEYPAYDDDDLGKLLIGKSTKVVSGAQWVGINGPGRIGKGKQGHAFVNAPYGVLAAIDETEWDVQEGDTVIASRASDKLTLYDGGSFSTVAGITTTVKGVSTGIFGVFKVLGRVQNGVATVVPVLSPRWIASTKETTSKLQKGVAQIGDIVSGTFEAGGEKCVTFANTWGRIPANRIVLLEIQDGTIIPVSAEC